MGTKDGLATLLTGARSMHHNLPLRERTTLATVDGLPICAKREDDVFREHPTIAPEIIACMSEGRDPTVKELGRVADRVEQDLYGNRSTSAWERPTAVAGRLISMRVALAALTGSGDGASEADDPMTVLPAAVDHAPLLIQAL